MKKLVVILFSLSILFASRQATHSQASLAAENVVDDIKITINGQTDTYTLIRDGRVEDQWYYVPNQPRIVERAVQGRIEPEFTMLRYQFPNPNDSEALIEDGLLQFAATLAAPPEAVMQMRAALAAKKGISANNLRLAALPLKASEVALYTPSVPNQTSKLLADAPQGGGIAPIFANQKMVFSVSVTKAGSDVMEAVVRGNSGIPVVVTYTYLGLPPPPALR